MREKVERIIATAACHGGEERPSSIDHDRISLMETWSGWGVEVDFWERGVGGERLDEGEERYLDRHCMEFLLLPSLLEWI